MNRPEYPNPTELPASLAAKIVAASLRKSVWVNAEGVAFWLNDLARANAIKAKHGGVVFPPIAS